MIWFFDIETTAIGRGLRPVFVLGCAVNEEGVEVEFHSEPELIKWIKSLDDRDRVIAHNGGGFDFLALLDMLGKQVTDVDGIVSAGSLIAVTIEIEGKKTPRFEDSFRLLNASLATITGEKTPFPLKCICKNGCGGYCAASPKIKGKDREALRDYCMNDVRILAKAYPKFLKTLEDNGLQTKSKNGFPRITSGSISISNMFLSVGDTPAPIERKRWETGKRATYGGRVGAFKVASLRGHNSDLCSAYPWAGCQELPYGQHTFVAEPARAERCFVEKIPGLYRIRAFVEAGALPPLPHRIFDRILWHTGEIEGWYPLPELLAALPFLRSFWVEGAMVFDRTVSYRDYFTKLYELKKEADKNKDFALRMAAKILLNAGYGKTASGNVNERLVMDRGRTAGQVVSFHGYSIIKEISESPNPWNRQEQAAYFTGIVRARLLGELTNKERKVVYCDTDGIYYEGSPLPHSKELGDWSYDGEYTNFVCVAPKAYAYLGEKGQTVKLKGVPMRDKTSEQMLADFEAYAVGDKVHSKSLTRIKSGIRNGFLLVNKGLSRGRASDPRVCGSDLILEDKTCLPLHLENSTWTYPGHTNQDETLKLHTWLRRGRNRV